MKEVTRRGFFGISASLALSVLNTQSFGVKQDPEFFLRENGIELRDEFAYEELKDIANVLSFYKERIGDVGTYNFSFGKLPFKEAMYEYQSDPEGDFYTERPLKGYERYGAVFQDTLETDLAPKEVIDKDMEWLKEHGQIAKGEEERGHNYQLVIAHEVMHHLSLFYGCFPEILDPYNNEAKQNFSKKWNKLGRKICENCERLKIEEDGLEYKRPEGHPAFDSYFFINDWGEVDGPGNGEEVLANTGAYLVLGKDYADEDKWFMKRVELVREEFKRIKSAKAKSFPKSYG